MYKKILVPTDGSEYSQRAFKESLKIAEFAHSEITVLNVVANPNEYWSYNLSYGFSLNDDTIKDLGKLAIELTIGTQKPSVPLKTKVRSGHPANVILEEIENDHIDLVIMGSHGKGFIKGTLLGSVSSRVVQFAPCPVLIVK